jgi:hypothetical protein
VKPSRKARDEAGGKSFDGFSLPPHAIVVVGVDTHHGPEHPLYSARAVRLANESEPLDGRMYNSIRSKGVLQPIRVRLEQVPETSAPESQPWPKDMHGKMVHVVVAGRHRVLYGRHVVDDLVREGEIRDPQSWQIKCTLEHAKTSRELVEVVADENVCRRVLGDDEIAEGIHRGVNIGLTIDEMADRYGVNMSKAKRLLARAEGVPAKPAKPKVERVPVSAIRKAIEHLNEEPAVHGFSNRDIAELLQCIRGEVPARSATHVVRSLLGMEEP